MANNFGWLIDSAHFVEDADGVRIPAGTSVLVRSYVGKTALPPQALIAGGHLPMFDTGSTPQIEVSPDNGATWHGPMQSGELVADTRYRAVQALQHGDLVTSLAAPEFGAALDGVTNDTAQFAAAYAATPEGGTLLIPPNAAVALPGATNFTKPIRIVGHGASFVKTGAALAQWLVMNSDRITFEGLTFNDSAGKVTGTLIACGGGYDRNTLDRCTFTSPAAIALRCTNQKRLKIAGCTFDDVAESVHLAGAIDRAIVAENEIRNWRSRGIYAYCTADGSPSKVHLLRNLIRDIVPGSAAPRYPIQTVQNGQANRMRTWKVVGNEVYGPAKGYLAADPGTADQIAFFFIDGLLAHGNTSYYGGDMGMTVENCRNFIVTDNDLRYNDVAGLALFSDLRHGMAGGNTCKDNGQNRNNDRTAPSRAGIRIATSDTTKRPGRIITTGNVLGNDDVAAKQQYGVSLTYSDDVTLGPDLDAGNAVGLYFKESNNTGTKTVTPVVL